MYNNFTMEPNPGWIKLHLNFRQKISTNCAKFKIKTKKGFGHIVIVNSLRIYLYSEQQFHIPLKWQKPEWAGTNLSL